MLEFFIGFLASFFLMEPTAWFLHKYVMHGPLWFVHEDHHKVDPKKKFQLNDAFALVFFAPSFFSILFGRIYEIHILHGVGYGIMAYGIVYFYVHEVIIHKRYKLFRTPNNKYIHWLVRSHRRHHAKVDKNDSTDFGMLFCNNFFLD